MITQFMKKLDLPEVMEIEKGSISPWTEEQFLKMTRRRNCICLIVLDKSNVVGCIIYDLLNNKIEVIKLIATSENVTKYLIELLFSKLNGHRRQLIHFKVHERELSVQSMLRSMGFSALRVIRNHFGEDDAYLMEYDYAAKR